VEKRREGEEEKRKRRGDFPEQNLSLSPLLLFSFSLFLLFSSAPLLL
jgi:hypothetical protein